MILLCTVPVCLFGQISVLDEEESIYSEELMNALSEYDDKVLDVNSASFNTLAQFPFWDERIAQRIIQYRAQFNGFIELDELKMIEGIDPIQLEFYRDFLSVGPLRLKESKGKGFDLMNRHYVYQLREDTSTTLHSHLFRAKIQYDKNDFGFLVKKDYGEQYWSGNSFDHQSLFWKRDLNHLGSFVLGDYKLSFGQGLVLNQSFSSYGGGQLIRPNTSSNENQFCRGIAYQTGKKAFPTLAFYSQKKLDGTISDQQIKVDWYERHDTGLKLARMNRIQEQIVGLYQGLKFNELEFGGVVYSETIAFDSITNQSVHYSIFGRARLWNGLLNAEIVPFQIMQANYSKRLSEKLSIRFLSHLQDRKKTPLFGLKGILKNNNQELFYSMSFDYALTKQLQIIGVYNNSYSGDYYSEHYQKSSIEAKYAIDDFNELRFRVRQKSKQVMENKGEVLHSRTMDENAQYRMFYQYGKESHQRLVVQFNAKKNSAYLFYYQFKKEVQRFKFYARYTVVKNKSSNPFYVYENDLLYQYAFQTYFRSSESFFMMLKWKVSEALNCSLRQRIVWEEERRKMYVGIQFRMSL